MGHCELMTSELGAPRELVNEVYSIVEVCYT